MANPWRLKELTPAQAADRLRAERRLIVPAGTLEMRAPHLPLGCDTIILDRMADDLSERTGVARAPTVEFGVHSRKDRNTPGFASVSRKTLHRVMNELIAAWEEYGGVEEVLVLTAHAIEGHQEALSTIRATGHVQVVDIYGLAFDGLLDAPGGPVHGGEIDTSLILHLRPELVPDREAASRVGASVAKGERLYQFIVGRIAARWLQ
jgi:creatinine amidohydrolase